MPDIALSDLAGSFERHLAATNKSPRTVETYMTGLAKLVAFLGPDKPIGSIRRANLEAFIADLLARMKPTSVSVYYRALQQFFRWAVDEDELDADPMAKMKPPIVPESPPPVVSDDDLRRILTACAGTDLAARRDTAIFRLLIDTGMRRSEVAGLTLESIDWQANTLLVLGKGRKPRVLPFGAKAAQALDRYLRLRRRHRDAHLPNLWLGHGGPMTDSGIFQVVRDRGRQAGVKVGPHQLRHTFAHAWQAAGGNEGDLMSLAGWKSPQMLRRYAASAAADRAREAHKRLRLGDRI